MNETLEWIEKAATENLKGHSQTVDTLAKEALTTLTILLAALSGAFGYALTASDYRIGAVVLTIYIFVICVTLVTRCMMIEEFPAITNEPRNLKQDGFPLDILRSVELQNMQCRIDMAAQRNAITAQWLNRLRIAAICSPLIFATITFATALANHSCGQVAAGG